MRPWRFCRKHVRKPEKSDATISVRCYGARRLGKQQAGRQQKRKDEQNARFQGKRFSVCE